jgi:hypothetical protein
MAEPVVETDRVLSQLIHADSKQGKSTLTSTAPFPHLVMDAEGSWKFIDERGYRSGVKLRKKTWDPLAEPVPRWDDTWDVMRVSVHSWQVMQATYQHLRMYEHDFVSLTLDSITEVQRRCKKNIRAATEQMQHQQWGQLLDQMDELIRGFRDLTLLPNPIRCVTFVSETVFKDGKWRPYMQGQIRDTMPYWVDICGYLYTELKADTQGAVQSKEKQLLIGAGLWPQYLVGERTQGRLPDIVINPDIAAMLAAVFPEK